MCQSASNVMGVFFSPKEAGRMKLFRLAAAVSLPIVLAAALFGQEPPQAPNQVGQPADQPGDQGAPPPAPPLNPQQLQDLVAPIALYPDTLLSQILVASTYPIEVVEAQQWLQQNRNLKGQKLMDAAKQQNWDPSIQALVAFPDVLARLNQDIRWTTDLGNAFLAQQPDVMNAVQQLRTKAEANGKLKSTPQETVTTETQNGQTAIEIVPPEPGVVYVPELQSRMGLGTAGVWLLSATFVSRHWTSVFRSSPVSIWASISAAAGDCGVALDGDGDPIGSAGESF